jgi:predicted Zn-dependent peptidase
MVGSLPARAAAMKTITSLFGSWEQKEVPKYEPGPIPEAKKQLVLVNRPGSVQADITVGRTAAVRREADYFTEVVASAILGTGASSRLFLDVREKRGYAYDAHTELNALDNAATMTAVTQIRNEVAADGIAAVLEHLDNMGKAPVTAEELRGAKSFTNGMFLMRLEPQAGLADQLVTMKVQGLSKDYLESYTTRVNSVEPEQIQRVAKKYFSPENSAIVVVGDAEQLQKPLEKLGKFTVVKPAQ